MNEFNNLEKMKRVAYVLRKVLTVVTWLLIFLAALLVIGEIVVSAMDDKYFTISDLYKGSVTFEVEGWFEYDLVGETGNSVSVKPLVLTIIPTLILAVIFYLINVKQIKNILKYLLEDKPFDLRSSKSLFVMGINFFVASVVFNLAGNLIASKVVGLLNVEVGDLSILPDTSMVFTGILLIILSGVFKYGYYLQEEYDETV